MKVTVKLNVLHQPVLPGLKILLAAMSELLILLVISSCSMFLICTILQKIRMNMEILYPEVRSAIRDLTASKAISLNLKPPKRPLMKTDGYTQEILE